MPKKKLTKAQVRSKLKKVQTILADLNYDFDNNDDSFVNITYAKGLAARSSIRSALKRLK